MKHSGASGDKNSELVELPARRGFSISYGGKTLLSRIDPIAQAERLAAEIPIKEKTLYFCPSPLYGYGLSILFEKLKPNSAVLCVEADEKLFEVSRTALGENTGTFSLLKATTAEDLCAFVRKTYGERSFSRLEEVRLSGGWQLFPQLYTDLTQALRREIALDWGNAITLIHLGRLYARNLIRNLALLPESENISSLNITSPTLVLGAGPSLDSVLAELSALWGGNIPAPNERHFKIICVDTCLPALIERQIIPDLVVILESQHWNLKAFMNARGLKIDTAIDLSALHASCRILTGKRYFFTTHWTNLALFKRLKDANLLPKVFPPLGSVGLNAVALALHAGGSPVLTGGIDFSFSPDAYHSRSTPGYLALQLKQNRFRSMINAGATFQDGTFSILSKTGTQIRSNPIMRNYRDIFEQEFGGNTKLMDINGPGLPLGIKIITPADAFAILSQAGKGTDSVLQPQMNTPSAGQKEKVTAFIQQEIDILTTIKDMLTGALPPDTTRLEELLETADYLWAHFPECAGAGGKRPCGTNLSFLKRVRAEIEPFLKLWEMAYDILSGGK